MEVCYCTNKNNRIWCLPSTCGKPNKIKVELFAHYGKRYVWRKHNIPHHQKNTIPEVEHADGSITLWSNFSPACNWSLRQDGGKCKQSLIPICVSTKPSLYCWRQKKKKKVKKGLLEQLIFMRGTWNYVRCVLTGVCRLLTCEHCYFWRDAIHCILGCHGRSPMTGCQQQGRIL